MVNAAELSSAIGGGIGQVFNQTMHYFGYFVIAGAAIGIFYAIYTTLQFKYKCEIYIPRNVGGKTYSIGAIKSTKIRVVKRRGVTKWKFFMKRVFMQPLEDKYILPGNKVKLFKIGDGFLPASIHISNPAMLIEPIPIDIKLWQSLEISQAAMEYQDNRSKLMPIFVLMGTILFCCILVGVTVWFTYNYAGTVVDAINKVSNTPIMQQAAAQFKP